MTDVPFRERLTLVMGNGILVVRSRWQEKCSLFAKIRNLSSHFIYGKKANSFPEVRDYFLLFAVGKTEKVNSRETVKGREGTAAFFDIFASRSEPGFSRYSAIYDSQVIFRL